MREREETEPRDRKLLIFTFYTSEQLEILSTSMIFNFDYFKKLLGNKKNSILL